MKYSLDILALGETRCKMIDKETLDQGNIYLLRKIRWSWKRRCRDDDDTKGAEKALTEWRDVYSRFLRTKFKSKQRNMSFIVCYAPTNDFPEKRKDEYYEELQRVIDEIPEKDMKIVIGDFNAKLEEIIKGYRM
ncbi:uncharacterized protein [Palaemon carinicauda]|uniref:uncharacterized protein n=1 Tax=Palaemon carinicauda TaxID=392227 RepID=UPI0035B58152